MLFKPDDDHLLKQEVAKQSIFLKVKISPHS